MNLLSRLAPVVATLAVAASAAFAQSPYPTKPVNIIVPWPPGGPSDIAARPLAKGLQDELKQPFVIDNTNPTVEERARYIAPAIAAGFRVVAYHLDLPIAVCIKRNAARQGKQRIPASAIYGTRKRLQPPTLAEGFQALYTVRLGEEGELVIEEQESGRTGEQENSTEH